MLCMHENATWPRNAHLLQQAMYMLKEVGGIYDAITACYRLVGLMPVRVHDGDAMKL